MVYMKQILVTQVLAFSSGNAKGGISLRYKKNHRTTILMYYHHSAASFWGKLTLTQDFSGNFH